MLDTADTVTTPPVFPWCSLFSHLLHLLSVVTDHACLFPWWAGSTRKSRSWEEPSNNERQLVDRFPSFHVLWWPTSDMSQTEPQRLPMIWHIHPHKTYCLPFIPYITPYSLIGVACHFTNKSFTLTLSAGVCFGGQKWKTLGVGMNVDSRLLKQTFKASSPLPQAMLL